jgi:hypothetical protein
MRIASPDGFAANPIKVLEMGIGPTVSPLQIVLPPCRRTLSSRRYSSVLFINFLQFNLHVFVSGRSTVMRRAETS